MRPRPRSPRRRPRCTARPKQPVVQQEAVRLNEPSLGCSRDLDEPAHHRQHAPLHQARAPTEPSMTVTSTTEPRITMQPMPEPSVGSMLPDDLSQRAPLGRRRRRSHTASREGARDSCCSQPPRLARRSRCSPTSPHMHGASDLTADGGLGPHALQEPCAETSHHVTLSPGHHIAGE